MLYHCHGYCFCGNYWLLNHLLQTRCIHACSDEMSSVKVTFPSQRAGPNRSGPKLLQNGQGTALPANILIQVFVCWLTRGNCILHQRIWPLVYKQYASTLIKLRWTWLKIFYVIKTTFHVLINFQYACHISKMSAHYFDAYGRAVCNVSSSKDGAFNLCLLFCHWCTS